MLTKIGKVQRKNTKVTAQTKKSRPVKGNKTVPRLDQIVPMLGQRQSQRGNAAKVTSTEIKGKGELTFSEGWMWEHSESRDNHGYDTTRAARTTDPVVTSKLLIND